MSKLKLIAIGVWAILLLSVYAEELCPLTRDEAKPSCGGEVKSAGEKVIEKAAEEDYVIRGDDLLIEDEASTKEEAPQEGHCSSKDKQCGDDIKYDPKENNPSQPNKAKEDYYSQKKKPQKKPEEPEIEYPNTFKHEEAFRQKGHERDEYLKSFNGSNYTTYFDFSLDEEELEYVKKQSYVVYPAKKFQFNHQGNFLHFYKTAYEKKLPVMFTTDAFLYALNEGMHRVLTNFIENVFILTLKRFYENIVHYIETLKENPDLTEHKFLLSQAQIFYGAGVDFLSDGISEYEGPADVNPYIKGLAALSRKFYTNTFGIMGKAKTLNTKSLMPHGFWRRSRRLGNVFICLRFFQLVKFDLRDDLKAIFLLGKMIVESGNKQIYNEIREMLHFIIGEDRNAPNFVEVYDLAKELGISDVYQLSDTQIDALHTQIDKHVSAAKDYKPDLGFTNDYFLYSQESYDKFKYDREFTSGLFARYNSIEDWVINKLMDFKGQEPRMMFSSWELVDAIHHASSYRPWVFNRYKGKQTMKNEQMVQYRDNIDVQENFEKAKYSIKHSMEKEPDSWKKNLNNYYHYLLYKSTRRIKHSKDPVYKHNLFKEKVFYTAWGAYTHFRRQMILMTLKITPAPPETEDCGLPEVHLEPHLEFYKEADKFWNHFKDRILQFTMTSEYYMQINYKMVKAQFSNTFSDVSGGIQIITKGIIKQESGTLTDEWRDKLNKLIWFDKEHNLWLGWYYNLFDRDRPDSVLNYDVWVSSVASFDEVEKLKFPGAALFDIMKFPTIAIAVVEDRYEKVKKIFLLPGYNVRETYRPLKQKPDVEELSKMIMDRN